MEARRNQCKALLLACAFALSTLAGFGTQLLRRVHVATVSAYEQRVGEQESFFDERTTVDDHLQLLRKMESELPGRTFYAVVKDSEVSKQVMQGRGSELVFEHETEGANVYLLNPASGA